MLSGDIREVRYGMWDVQNAISDLAQAVRKCNELIEYADWITADDKAMLNSYTIWETILKAAAIDKDDEVRHLNQLIETWIERERS